MKNVKEYCEINKIECDAEIINNVNDLLMDYCNEYNIDYFGDVLNDYYEFSENLIKDALDGKVEILNRFEN